MSERDHAVNKLLIYLYKDQLNSPGLVREGDAGGLPDKDEDLLNSPDPDDLLAEMPEE